MLLEDFSNGRLDRVPDGFRIVLDPAGARVELRELTGGTSHDATVRIDQEDRGPRRALVNG